MTIEIKEAIDGISKSIDSIAQRHIIFEKRFDELEKKITTPKVGVSLPGVNEGKEKFSFSKALLGISTKDWSFAQFEKSVFDETRKKALSMGVGSAGGFIVPEQYVAELVELLRAKTVVLQAGARVLAGLTGSPVEIPKQTGASNFYWIGENSTITASDQTFGQIALTPKTGAALTKLSNKLLKLGTPDVEQFVREDLADTIAQGIDVAAFTADGTANNPTGIAATTGINTVAIGTNGGAITIDLLYDMLYEIDADNAVGDKTAWVLHPRTISGLKKLKDSQGRYLLQPDPTLAARNTMLGFPVFTSTQLRINLTKGTGTALAEIFLGNFNDLILGQWGNLELLASQEAGGAFENNQTFIRVIQDLDIGLRHPEAFCRISDSTT